MTYLDSLVVYGKSKSSFGWDDEGESPGSVADPVSQSIMGSRSCAAVAMIDGVMGKTLKALELAITIWPVEASLRDTLLEKTISVVSACQVGEIDYLRKKTNFEFIFLFLIALFWNLFFFFLFVQPLPQTCQSAKYLLFVLNDFHKVQFHASKDAAIILHATRSLEELIRGLKGEEKVVLDSSRFLQIVNSLRPIATKRPANLYQQLMDNVDESRLLGKKFVTFYLTD